MTTSCVVNNAKMEVSDPETKELDRLHFELGKLRAMQTIMDKWFPNVAQSRIQMSIDVLADRIVELEALKVQVI
jgi:hypothetical protein